jgi:hypothetical protein
MGVSRRHLALGVVLLALSAGCTNPADNSNAGADGEAETPAATSGGHGGGSSGGGGGSGGGSGGGGGGSGGGGGVIGSPIRMPGFQQIGAEIVTVYDGLVAEIAAACGPGGLCVEIVVESEDGKGPESTCGFAGTRPGEDELVERGSTVVFLTTPPCPDFEGTDESGGSTDSTGPNEEEGGTRGGIDGTDGGGTGTDSQGTDGTDDTDGGGTSGTEGEVPSDEGATQSTPPENPGS